MLPRYVDFHGRDDCTGSAGRRGSPADTAGAWSCDPLRNGPFWAATILALLAIVGCVKTPVDPILERNVAQSARQGALTTTPIVFATTDFYFWPKKVDAYEGLLDVPENRARPTGRTYRVHYVRFPSTASQPGYPVVYLAGGPGGSATMTASEDRFPLFMKFRAIGDVIAYDQRGTQYSSPRPTCQGSWSYPLDRPLEESTLKQVTAPFLAQCAEQLSGSVDLAAFNTRENADDLEDLRKVLGAEKLNLWGISYGTHLALAYIRRYPNRVNRAVLAGVEGPDDTWKLPANIELVLERADAAIKADPKARSRIPELIEGLRRTLAILEAQAVTVEVMDVATMERHRVTVGANDLRRAVFFLFGEREKIQERLVSRLAPILNGDYTSLAIFAYGYRSERSEAAMPLSMNCASGATAARLEEIRRQAATTVLGDAANLFLRVQCEAWPPMDLGDDFRSAIRSDVPVLAISGTFDNRTPPPTAEEVLKGFPNGHHLIIDGGAHDDDLFLSSPRIVKEMVGFLKDGHLGTTRIELGAMRFE